VTNAGGSVESNPATLTVAAWDGFWKVDIDAPAGGDGLTWATAFEHPQDAVDAASAGEEIWIAEGTYVRKSGSDTVVLMMKDGVSVYGGFAGTEGVRTERDPAVRVTTLDGEDVAYHVIVSASNATLDGFTVTRGNANGVDPDHVGGGIYSITTTSLSVARCRFVGNTAVHSGAAMRFDQDTNLTLSDIVIRDNTAGAASGGVSLGLDVTGTISRCVFDNNTAQHSSALQIIRSPIQVDDCVFVNNTATSAFGGPAIRIGDIGSPSITNCSFFGNSSAFQGEAVHVLNSATPTFSNCVFWGNGTVPEAELYVDGTSTAIVTYSLVEGGWAGTGNIDAIPFFVDSGDLDGPDDIWITFDDGLRLLPGSPCIDAADGDAAPATDIEGHTRYDDPDTTDSGVGTITYADIGAYEFD
jgi:hypothetical protein